MPDIFDPIHATVSQHASVDRWNTLLNAIAPQFGVPPNLAKAHMLYESGGDPTVISGDGGYGLMQITSGVVGGKYNGENILDPYTNIKVACRDFIKPAMEAFPGDLDAVVAAYNAGIGAVQQALAEGKPPSAVTYAGWYVPSVTGAYSWFNQMSHAAVA